MIACESLETKFSYHNHLPASAGSLTGTETSPCWASPSWGSAASPTADGWADPAISECNETLIGPETSVGTRVVGTGPQLMKGFVGCLGPFGTEAPLRTVLGIGGNRGCSNSSNT